MAQPFTIYKITILYMLNCVDFPLSNTQFSNFFLDQEYTDYFRVQEVLSDLENSNLIQAHITHSNTQYTLTEKGRDTLNFFKDKLSDGIISDVSRFFEKNQMEMKSENSVIANYYRTSQGKYSVNCCVRSGDTTVMDLALLAANKEQAETMCANWRQQSDDVYAYLMDLLMQ